MNKDYLLSKICMQEIEIKVLKEIIFEKFEMTNDDFLKYYQKIIGNNEEEICEYFKKSIESSTKPPTKEDIEKFMLK